MKPPADKIPFEKTDPSGKEEITGPSGKEEITEKDQQASSSKDDQNQGSSGVELRATSLLASLGIVKKDGEVYIPMPESDFVAVFKEDDLPPFIKRHIDSFRKIQIDIEKSRRERLLRGEPGPEGPSSGPNTGRAILFQVLVNHSNRLSIPYDVAENVFPATSSPALTNLITEFPLTITGPDNRDWDFTYVCFDPEKCFLLMKGWPEYSARFNLKHLDSLFFLNPVRRVSPNHFRVCHRSATNPAMASIFNFAPQFLDENFMFEVELTRREIVTQDLIVPNELVRQHLPGYGAGARVSAKQRILMLTDGRDKDWYVVVAYSRSMDQYRVMDGWGLLMRDHGLEAGDSVRFYKPDFEAREHHYLIQCVKKQKPEEEDKGPEEEEKSPKEEEDKTGTSGGGSEGAGYFMFQAQKPEEQSSSKTSTPGSGGESVRTIRTKYKVKKGPAC